MHYFNPRPRMGGDSRPGSWKNSGLYFNPRPRMGGDQLSTSSSRSLYVDFNPRPRMGGDFTPLSDTFISDNFNPRPRMGGDRNRKECRTGLHNFNPRPRMGGDFVESHNQHDLWHFNPRPRMGGDLIAKSPFSSIEFQSTPPHGGRLQIFTNNVYYPTSVICIFAKAFKYSLHFDYFSAHITMASCANLTVFSVHFIFALRKSGSHLL